MSNDGESKGMLCPLCPRDLEHVHTHNEFLRTSPDPKDARIAELERQVDELDAKAMAEEMLKNGNYRLYEREKIRAETAEAKLSGVQTIIDLFNQLEPDWDWKKLQDELTSTPLPSEPPASTVRLILNILCSTTLDLVGESKAKETAEARVKALEGAFRQLLDDTAKLLDHEKGLPEGVHPHFMSIAFDVLHSKSALEQKEGV